MISLLYPWIVTGAAIGCVLGFADALALLLRARFMFLDKGELFSTILCTLGITLGWGVFIFALIGVIVIVFTQTLYRNRIFRYKRLRLLLAALLFLFPLLGLLWQLTAGPRASQMPFRTVLVPLFSLATSLIGVELAMRLASWARHHQESRGKLAIGGTAAALGLYLIDLLLLVRLYPVFHYALTALAFGVGGFSYLLWLGSRKQSAQGSIVAMSVAAALLLGAGSLCYLMQSENARFVVQEKTAVASDIVVIWTTLRPRQNEPVPEEEAAEIRVDSPSVPAGNLVRPGASVMLITVDAMRYDRLTALGSKKSIAPNLDALAEQSVVFKRAYTAIPHTSHAICSLMTGKFTHQLQNVPGVPPAHETWADVMHRFRYKTAAFFSHAIFFIDKGQFEPYIRTSYGFQHREVEYNVPAAKRAESLIKYLRGIRGNDSPFFAWTHFFDPHEPYDKSCSRFGGRPQDRYDCEIAKVDEAIGKIISYLDEAHPNTIVIATADHGEEFGDHGGNYHGTTLYDEQVRIPLLVRIPELPPRVTNTPVSLVDLPGTILGILDIPPPARMRSRDLSGLMTGTSRDFDTFATVHDKTMVVRGEHKLIWDLNTGVSRLYHLRKDPLETRSVADSKPDIVNSLKKKISAWRRSHAHHELRPIADSAGDRSWPLAIRKALGGDLTSAPQLARLIQESSALSIRHKAASLLYQLREQTGAATIPNPAEESDPIVAAWLLLFQMQLGSVSVPTALYQRIMKDLKPEDEPWREMAIVGYRAGVHLSIPHLLTVATDTRAPLEQRIRGIRLIGKSGKRLKTRDLAVTGLLNMIDEYQLTMEVAAALGTLGDRRATPRLIKRLKRERFLERKSKIIQSLVTLRGKGSLRAVAGELLLPQPPTPILSPLAGLSKTTQESKIIKLSDKKTTVHFYLSSPASPIRPKLSRLTRIVIGTDSTKSRGTPPRTFSLSCNGRQLESVPVVPGRHEVLLDITSCESQRGSRPHIELVGPEGEHDLPIFALAIVGE